MEEKVDKLKEFGYTFQFLSDGQSGGVTSVDSKIIQIKYNATDDEIMDLLDNRLEYVIKKENSLYKKLKEYVNG